MASVLSMVARKAGVKTSPPEPTRVTRWVLVTAKHIRDGMVMDCKACPIALAMRAVLKRGHYADVIQTSLDVYDNDGFVVALDVPLPEAVTDFIVAFDNGLDVQPQAFKVVLPRTVVR